MSKCEEQKKTVWERLQDYFSRRALLREYFVPSTTLPPREGIELLANLTTVERCFRESESRHFLLNVLEGQRHNIQEWGWHSQDLHFLAQGSLYSLLLDGFQGEVGNLQMKYKTISKRGRKLYLIRFGYSVDGYYDAGLIIPRPQYRKRYFVIDKYRGFTDETKPRLHLITGNRQISATLEQRCGISIADPTGVFLFEDDKQNLYLNPPQHKFRNHASYLAYPSYVGELLEVQKGNSIIQVAVDSHLNYDDLVIVGKPHPYFLRELAWRVSFMKERKGEEYIQKYQLEWLDKETIDPNYFEPSVIGKFLDAWKGILEERDLPINMRPEEYIEQEVSRIRTLQRNHEYTLQASDFQLAPEYRYNIPGIWYDK